MSGLEYKPRGFQQDLDDDTSRFIVAAIHRRGGKTVNAVNRLIRTCQTCPLPNPRTFYVAPFRTQAKQIAWDYVREYTEGLPVKLSSFELTCDFENGARLQLLGADGYHKHRGKYVDDVVFDEVSDIPPAAWREVFRPALADRNGRAMFIGTPRGRDFFRDLWDNGGKLDGWHSYHLTAHDTGIIPADELEQLRLEMTAAEFAQEFLCDWEVGRPGAYYANQINRMLDDGRITEIGRVRKQPVMTSWYFDKTDAVVVTFWQVQANGELRIIESMRRMDATMSDVCEEVLDKPHTYTKHMAPFNASTEPNSRISVARANGIRLRPVRKLEVIDQIYNVKELLANTRIDATNSFDLVEALRQFHATYDETRRVYTEKPVADWAAQYAHSIGVFASGYRPKPASWLEPVKYPEKVSRAA